MPLPTEIDWPQDVLGCALRASYRVQPVEQFLILEVEDGPDRRRLISSEEQLMIDMEFLFDPQQLLEFEIFMHTTLRGGSLWFNMPVQTGLGMIPHIMHLQDERTVAPHRQRTDRYVVTFTVEAYRTPYVIPPPFVPEDPVDAGNILDVLPTDIFDAGVITDPLPEDVINAVVPGAYV